MSTVTPFVNAAQVKAFGSYGIGNLLRKFDDPTIEGYAITATRAIETRCDRRLAPFTITETSRAEGVDTDEYGRSDLPLDLQGSLGRSKSIAFGATSLVRHFWLRNHAPIYQDLWAYSGIQVVLVRSFGDTQQIPASQLEGPEADTGHCRFRLGTFVPIGTTLRVTYSGGYQTIPEDLEQACIFQIAKFAILAAEPDQRKDMSTAELDGELTALLAPYAKF